MKVDLTGEEAAWLEMAANLISEDKDDRPAKAGRSAAQKLRGALERAGWRRENGGAAWRMPAGRS